MLCNVMGGTWILGIIGILFAVTTEMTADFCEYKSISFN